jgi:CDP-4-dehydro-6-deoxyglucose reductase
MGSPRLLNLARAARLVGTTRGALQQKIQAGELDSFDGMVTLDELQRAFPEAALEDNTVLEHVESIKERAFGRRIAERALPSAEVLAARVHEMGKELAESKALLSHSTGVFEGLNKLLEEWRGLGGERASLAASLKDWLHDQMLHTPATDNRAYGLLLRDSLLRVMAAQVKLLPSGEEFFVEGGDTILEAALRVGIPLAYGCSSSSCGGCKARVVSGQVKQLRPHDFKLAPGQIAQGGILMCSYTAVTDLVIEADVAQRPKDIASQAIDAEIKGVEFPTGEVAIVHVQTPRSHRLRFMAGQRVRLTFGHTLTAELPVASCPCEDRHLEFHVRKIAGNPFSDHVFQNLPAGEALHIEGPYGEFVLNPSSMRPVLLIAFGTGFAPIKSLMEHAMALDNAPAIHLIWIAARESALYLPNLARAWADALDNFDYTPLIAGNDLDATASRQEDAVAKALGRELARFGDLAQMDSYVAGPDLAVAAAVKQLITRGMPVTQIVADYEG